MKCQTYGCTGRTVYGGHCPACEILFGSYARLLQYYPEATFADSDWFTPTESPADDPTEPPTEEVPLVVDGNVTTSDT